MSRRATHLLVQGHQHHSCDAGSPWKRCRGATAVNLQGCKLPRVWTAKPHAHSSPHMNPKDS
eukprot:2269212-Amphidinium_carterae.1